jgi:hypothetical protein
MVESVEEELTERTKEEKENKIKWAYERFIYDICPFGSLDIRAGIEHLQEYGFSQSLEDCLDEYKEAIGQSDNDDIDITYVAFDFVFQNMRNKIVEICNFDIENDAGYSIFANCLATTIDYKEEDKLALSKKINENLEKFKCDEYLFDYCKDWLGYEELKKD